MIFTTAAERALKTAKPGTVEFRKALRDEILNTKELPWASTRSTTSSPAPTTVWTSARW